MNTYESRQKQLFRSQDDVYAVLSDLRHLERYWTAVPEQHKSKVQDLKIEQDAISFSVSPVGKVVLRLVDSEAPKMLKFGADNFPIQFNFWIQLVGVSDSDTRMKLTLKADIPLMLRPMVGSKLDDGIERVADMMAQAINAGM
ncbi:MAG: SRPBCC family protein [Candidatus Aphodosoma sp.]